MILIMVHVSGCLTHEVTKDTLFDVLCHKSKWDLERVTVESDDLCERIASAFVSADGDVVVDGADRDLCEGLRTFLLSTQNSGKCRTRGF